MVHYTWYNVANYRSVANLSTSQGPVAGHKKIDDVNDVYRKHKNDKLRQSKLAN